MRQQLSGRRFKGGGRQCSIEIRLMKWTEPVACRFRIGAQPPEGELVRHNEYDLGIGGGMPMRKNVRIRCSELERGMSDLTYLGSRRKISPGDEVEPRKRNLEVRHAGNHTWNQRGIPHRFRFQKPGNTCRSSGTTSCPGSCAEVCSGSSRP